ALATATLGVGAGGGAFAVGFGAGGGAFAGVSTLPCLALVQLDSDGFDAATAPDSGKTDTTRATNGARCSNNRGKGRMIDRLRRVREAPGASRAVCFAHTASGKLGP